MKSLVARYFGMMGACLGVVVAGHMALLAICDGIPRQTLTGRAALAFAEHTCQQIAGCRSLKIEAGYDWRNSQRRIIYHLQTEVPLDRDQISLLLFQHAQAKTRGLLQWTLTAPAILDLQVVRPHTVVLPRKVSEGVKTWS